MKLRFIALADKDYAGLPVAVRMAFAKRLQFLPANLRHPSIGCGRLDAAAGWAMG